MPFMGTCYTIILLDEFDWGYVDNSRENTVERINNYLKELKRGGRVIAQFPHGIVVDLEKIWPWDEEMKRFLMCNCDTAWLFSDHNVGSLTKLG